MQFRTQLIAVAVLSLVWEFVVVYQIAAIAAHQGVRVILLGLVQPWILLVERKYFVEATDSSKRIWLTAAVTVGMTVATTILMWDSL